MVDFGHGDNARIQAAHVRRWVRGRPRTRPCRRAVGLAGGARVAARSEAFHRPQGRPAGREPQRPLPAGIVRRRKLPPPAASRVYELTEWGEELEPVIVRLGRWGARSPSKPRDAALGVDSLVLSLRTMFDPRAAGGLRAGYELRLGEDRFRAVVDDGRFEISRGAAERPDVIVESDSDTLAGLLYAARPLAEALESGHLKVEGDRAAFERFLGLFPLPAPAPPAGA
jgi:hypothetical protein